MLYANCQFNSRKQATTTPIIGWNGRTRERRTIYPNLLAPDPFLPFVRTTAGTARLHQLFWRQSSGLPEWQQSSSKSRGISDHILNQTRFVHSSSNARRDQDWRDNETDREDCLCASDSSEATAAGVKVLDCSVQELIATAVFTAPTGPISQSRFDRVPGPGGYRKNLRALRPWPWDFVSPAPGASWRCR